MITANVEQHCTPGVSMSGGGGGARLEVLWAATAGVGTALTDKFLTWGADISLYEVAPLSQLDGKPSYITLSERTGAVLVASNSNCQYVKCVDVCGTGWQEPLLALGHANGKVLLTSFGHGDTARELVPRHARTCNSVAWNRSEQSMLATALDKYRSDHCILLWDVNKCTSSDGSTSPHVNSGMSSSWQGPVGPATAGVELARPIAEMGLSETAHSVAWTHFGCRLLLASMNQKHIKIFDLRDFSNKAVTVANTKYCYGVCADPFNEWQVASRAECTVCVWDARHPERPLLTLPQPKPVTSILWCPTRRNLLGSLQRDSRSLHLHDLQQAPDLPSSPSSPPANSDPAIVNCTESGACVLERSVSLSSGHTITGFSWHPTHQARLLAIAVSGKIMEYTVLERVTVSWGGGGDGGGGGQLVWSHGGRALHTPPVAFLAAHRDISHKMKSRATTDYGLKPELLLNGDLADDEGLKNLWKWLFRSKSLVEEGCIRGTQWRHPGVRSALKMEAGCATAAGGYRSEAVPALATDLGTLHYTTYKSAERTHALQLCGWGWQSVSAALGKLEAEGPASRAAAVAVFHLRFRDALDILGRAPQNSLRVVALALAGYSEERGVWRDLATLLLGSKAALDDAYLRAVLSFLTSDGHDYKAVLNESEMRLEDRVAFACLFLDDSRLQEYVRTLSAKLTAHGDLDGILLTGMSTDGIALLQRWVDHSGDVQSAALLAARTFTADMLRDPRVVDWIARSAAHVLRHTECSGGDLT